MDSIQELWVRAARSQARNYFEWGFSPAEVIERVVDEYREVAVTNLQLEDATVDAISEDLTSLFSIDG